jgi:prepilin-type N-terminal cleavage/methylation domain-containing protein
MKERVRSQKGFTLIEMIGVLAIIAILIAAVAPRIFEAISDSRVSSFCSTLRTIQTAVSKYYSDVGTLFPLGDANGVPMVGSVSSLELPNELIGLLSDGTGPWPGAATGGLWNKYAGPYLDKFVAGAPPIGSGWVMPAQMAAASAAGDASSTSGTKWDLNGDDQSDFSVNVQIVTVEVDNVSYAEFLKVDNIIDSGIGGTDLEKEKRGKVKWDPAGLKLRIFIANK